MELPAAIMSKDDDIVILNFNEDNDKTLFQTDEDRQLLAQEIFGSMNTEEELTDCQVETTMQMTVDSLTQDQRPFWQKTFG
jgi:hypothetical protein